jgi:hypothetical protein
MAAVLGVKTEILVFRERTLMKPTLTKSVLALFAFAVVAAIVVAEEQSRNVLGKIDHQALLEAAPGIPATTTEASKRTYGTEINANADTAALDSFYAPFYRRVAAARDVIKGAVDARAANQEALAQRSRAQADASPIVNRMGGTDKIGEMSEAEAQQAAIQAAGDYQQSLAGAPANAPSGCGMQAMMQRMMNDPAYQERFEKMTKQEQEAEMRKYMGNAQAPAPPTEETAAERRAKRATDETAAVIARQKELSDIRQRMNGIDAVFTKKDQAILATPGGYDQIAREISARVEKLPVVATGEAGDMVDPVKLQALQREQATRERTRATWELQQRAALYGQRKARYKEVAAAYTAWLKQSLGTLSSETAQVLDDATVEMAVGIEEDLIGLSENLAKYTAEATRYAAQYERSYQDRMSEPAARPFTK